MASSSHNKAKGNAHQYNITIATTGNIEHELFHILTLIARTHPDVASALKSVKGGPEAAVDLYRSMGNSSQLADQHLNDVSAANGIDTLNYHSTSRPDSQSTNGVPHDDRPPVNSWFEVDLFCCIKQYPSPVSSRRVLDVLGRKDVEKVNCWRNLEECDYLFVRQSINNTPSDWTTDLTLETMGEIIDANKSTQQRRLILAHFCKQHADEKKNKWGWGGLMVQDFVDQLRKLRTERFPKAVGHPDGKPREVLEDREELWNQFRQSVLDTDAKTIFIFLDNLDWMFGNMEEHDFKKFIDGLERARKVIKSSGIVLKVMVTCSKHLPAIEECFENGIPQIDINHPPSARSPGGSWQG